MHTYIETGVVTYTPDWCPRGCLHLTVRFETDASGDAVYWFLPGEDMDVIIERVVSHIHGTYSDHTIYLYDEFGVDVLQSLCGSMGGTGDERPIYIDLGGDRRGVVQTMGPHVLRVDAVVATTGMLEFYARRARGV